MTINRTPIRETILANYASGHLMTLREIVDQFGISLRAAHTIRSELVRENALPAEAPRHGGRTASANRSGKGPPLAVDEQTLEDILAGRATSLSTDQQRAFLSAIIISAPSAIAKVAAQNALTRLDAQAGASQQLGPGPPLSEEEYDSRLSRLMLAAGLVRVRRALKIAFPLAYERYDKILAAEATSGVSAPILALPLNGVHDAEGQETPVS